MEEFAEAVKKVTEKYPELVEEEEIKPKICYELESFTIFMIYQKGWHYKQDFLDAYNEEFKEHPQYLENVTVDEVIHDYVRLVPEPGYGNMLFMLDQEPKRGAFKITHIVFHKIQLKRAREKAIEYSYEDGYQTRLGGRPKSACKYKVTTEMFREWMRGYNVASLHIEHMKAMGGE